MHFLLRSVCFNRLLIWQFWLFWFVFRWFWTRMLQPVWDSNFQQLIVVCTCPPQACTTIIIMLGRSGRRVFYFELDLGWEPDHWYPVAVQAINFTIISVLETWAILVRRVRWSMNQLLEDDCLEWPHQSGARFMYDQCLEGWDDLVRRNVLNKASTRHQELRLAIGKEIRIPNLSHDVINSHYQY